MGGWVFSGGGVLVCWEGIRNKVVYTFVVSVDMPATPSSPATASMSLGHSIEWSVGWQYALLIRCPGRQASTTTARPLISGPIDSDCVRGQRYINRYMGTK